MSAKVAEMATKMTKIQIKVFMAIILNENYRSEKDITALSSFDCNDKKPYQAASELKGDTGAI
jgi:hypothetical protein